MARRPPFDIVSDPTTAMAPVAVVERVRTVRVLHGPDELADATVRAAEGARRLQDKLDARAARDAWMTEHAAEATGWRRFASQRRAADGAPAT